MAARRPTHRLDHLVRERCAVCPPVRGVMLAFGCTSLLRKLVAHIYGVATLPSDNVEGYNAPHLPVLLLIPSERCSGCQRFLPSNACFSCMAIHVECIYAICFSVLLVPFAAHPSPAFDVASVSLCTLRMPFSFPLLVICINMSSHRSSRVSPSLLLDAAGTRPLWTRCATWTTRCRWCTCSPRCPPRSGTTSPARPCRRAP